MLEPYVGVKVEMRRERRRSSGDQYVVQGLIQTLVMSCLSLKRVCLEEEEDGAICHMYPQDINIMKKEENEVQVQDEPSRRDHGL